MSPELLPPTTAEVIAKFAEDYGFNGVVIICLFALGWKLLGLMKAESVQQTKILNLYSDNTTAIKSLDTTTASLDATLAKWFKVSHDDSTETSKRQAAQTDGINALTEKIDVLGNTMTQPSIEDILKAIAELRTEIVELRLYGKEVFKEVLSEFETKYMRRVDAVETRVEAVETTVKKVTTEHPAVEVPTAEKSKEEDKTNGN